MRPVTLFTLGALALAACHYVASPGDVDGDGDADLVLHFERAELVARGDLNATTTELVLRATLTDGRKIRGVDAVRVVP
jgi:hypothetical protein